MPEDDVKINALAAAHALQSASQSVQSMLTEAASFAGPDGTFPMTTEMSELIVTLLDTQSTLLARLMEHEAQMDDELDKIKRNLKL